MKKTQVLFVITALSLSIGALGAYTIFLNHFGQGFELQARIQHLEQKFLEEQTRNNLLSYQLQDLQQTVALAMPKDKKLIASLNDAGKSLASSLRLPASVSKIDTSSVAYARAQDLFKKRKFSEAAEKFKVIGEKYPTSGYVVQAHFFVIESLFNKKDYKTCLEEIEKMMMLFPEHELTGFAMMRMAAISDSIGQLSEAQEIARTVLAYYEHPDLVKSAQIYLNKAEE